METFYEYSEILVPIWDIEFIDAVIYIYVHTHTSKASEKWSDTFTCAQYTDTIT